MISEMSRKNRGQRSVRNLHHLRNEWVGVSLDDPNLLDRLLSAAKRVHLPLRDELIVLIAGRYGASIRDILRLTIGDWQACEGQLEIRVRRQVSQGQGVRMLGLGPATASLLRAYIQRERKECDPEHRDVLQLSETDPLFLTTEGWTYGYQAFVPQWETLCKAAGLSLPIHGLRHWFVILKLRQIEERTHDPDEQQRCKAALIRYMGWQNPKALRVYERENFREKHMREFNKFLDEFYANDPPSLSPRSGVERREEGSSYLNYWYME